MRLLQLVLWCFIPILLILLFASFVSYIYIYISWYLNFFLSSGDTFTDGSVRYTMTSMNVPEPVMSLAISPVSKDSGGQVSTANWDINLLCNWWYQMMVIFYPCTVFKGFESLSERGSYFPCWVGRWEWAGLIYDMHFTHSLEEEVLSCLTMTQNAFLCRQLFLEWESCIWTFTLNAFGGSIRCLVFLSFFNTVMGF